MRRLETDRLILREWKLSDKEDLFEYAQSELVGPNAGWKPHKDINESVEIINMFIGDEEVYAIELKNENKVIGGFGIHKCAPAPQFKDLKQREIGYVLNPKYWGNGYVPEAVFEAIDCCFEELELDILWCAHFDFNMKSKRVNEKCGFKYHFTKEEVLKRLDDKKVSTLYYKINKEDWISK
jgi:RimJ/RimL family protein N-acetyltransferase